MTELQTSKSYRLPNDITERLVPRRRPMSMADIASQHGGTFESGLRGAFQFGVWPSSFCLRPVHRKDGSIALVLFDGDEPLEWRAEVHGNTVLMETK